MRFSFLVLTCLAIFAFVSSASAQEPKLLSVHKDWSAFTFMEDGKKVCFMASQPSKSQGNYTSRGEVFALITHRPGDNSFEVVGCECALHASGVVITV